MSPLLLSLIVIATPPRTLASPGLTAINIDERVANFYSEFFAQELAQRSGFRVVTSGEVATLLGLERQKQLLGCSEETTSCMAELAGALGADGVVMGSIARLGSGFAVTLKVISPGDARTLAMRTGRSKDEDALLDWLTETAQQVSGQLRSAFSPLPQPAAPLPPDAADQPLSDSGNPRRIARNGRLFSELETARYFVAKKQGLSEAAALLEAKGLTPVTAAQPPDAGIAPLAQVGAVDAGPFVPAPLPRKVARAGKVLTEAQTRRYYEARANGRPEADAFAWASTTPKEDATPAPVAPQTVDAGSRAPLPPGLPSRIARDGKLLSVEETDQYFREKLKLK